MFSLRDLLTVDPDKKVRDFMTENPVSVRTLTPARKRSPR